MSGIKNTDFKVKYGSEKVHNAMLDARPDSIVVERMMRHGTHESVHKRLERHDNTEYRAAYARVTTNPDHLHNLAKDEDSNVRFNAASNHNASSSHLEHMLHDPDIAVRRTLAHHKNLKADQASRIKSDDDPSHSIAMSQTRFMELHGTLIHHPDDNVRARVAGHTGASAEHVMHLVKDPSPEVRGAVAKNVAHTKMTHPILMHDKHPFVRNDVAMKADVATSAHMAEHDPDQGVKITAYRRHKIAKEESWMHGPQEDKLPKLFGESTQTLNSFKQFITTDSPNNEQD